MEPGPQVRSGWVGEAPGPDSMRCSSTSGSDRGDKEIDDGDEARKALLVGVGARRVEDGRVIELVPGTIISPFSETGLNLGAAAHTVHRLEVGRGWTVHSLFDNCVTLVFHFIAILGDFDGGRL